MGNRWGPEGPPDEAYSRLTDPERFAPVVVAADALVERLVADYDVSSAPVELEHTVRAVRLQPARGAPLTVGITDFPGVRLVMGHWCSAPVPQCGCDACDETAVDAVRDLLGTVGDVVAGRFSERLTRRPRRLWSSYGSPSGGSQGWSSLGDAEYDALAAVAPPGEHVWPAWPRREP
jgi:hypothetical protein